MKVISSTRLTVIVPPHDPEAVNVRVITAYGTSKAVSRDQYKYTSSSPSQPTLDNAAPTVPTEPLPSPIVPLNWSGPNPTSNCPSSGFLTGVIGLDYCGATLEGLAPLSLPDNWTSLTDPQRGFVLMNLERVERNETPIVGISTTLDNYAAEGADADTDPPVSFITDGVGGSIWDSGDFVTYGMVGFMYYDGPGQLGFNLDCTSTDTSGCWGHRDNILDAAANTNLAVGVADGPSGDSAAVISDQFSDFNFLWTTEVSDGYPNGVPASSSLTKPSITGITDEGNGLIDLTGTNLDTGTSVYFSNIADSNRLNCSSPNDCKVQAPSGLAPNTIYNVYVLNPAGLSPQSSRDYFKT